MLDLSFSTNPAKANVTVGCTCSGVMLVGSRTSSAFPNEMPLLEDLKESPEGGFMFGGHFGGLFLKSPKNASSRTAHHIYQKPNEAPGGGYTAGLSQVSTNYTPRNCHLTVSKCKPRSHFSTVTVREGDSRWGDSSEGGA